MADIFNSEKVLEILTEEVNISGLGLAIYPVSGSHESRLKEDFLLCTSGTFLFRTEDFGEPYLQSMLILQGECDLLQIDASHQVLSVETLVGSKNDSNIYASLYSNSTYLLVVKSNYALFLLADVGATPIQIEKIFSETPIIPDRLNYFSNQSISTQIEKESERVFRRQDNKGAISTGHLNILQMHLKETCLDRVRICVHCSDDSLLQEMFMVFDRSILVTPAYHPEKDESIFVIRGSVEIITFDISGNQESIIQLEAWDNSNQKPSFYRIKMGVLHTLLVTSDYAILKETTSGPFRKSSTAIPQWGIDYVNERLSRSPVKNGKS